METPLLFLLAALIFVFFQDWKYRRIHVVLPLSIFLASLYLIYLKSLSFKNMLLNTAFFLVTLSILVLYMSLKSRKFLNPFEHYFGLGDLLFYVAVTPLFILPNFIVFFILSMIFALVLQLAFKKMMAAHTVPLAGFSALFLGMVLIRDYCAFYPKLTLI